MPRAASTSTEEKTVKKAPRKRAAPKKTTTAKKTTTRKAPAKKAPAKVLASEDEVLEVETAPDMSSTRKAPTKFAQARATQRTKRNQYIVIGLLIIVGIGSSAAVGFSDSEAGQINVAQTIKERNERMANLVDVNGPTVVVPIPSQAPDGGLTGLRPADPTPAPVAASATSTATTTSATATSTATSTDDSVVTEDGVTDPPANLSATDTATTTVDAVAVDPELADSSP